MGDARDISLRPLPGVTPDQARDARARAWRFIFDCWQQKQRATAHVPTAKGCDDRKRLAYE
jgi:hypothetical protein